MHGLVGTNPPAQDLDCDFLQPAPAKLAIKSLEAKLRATIRELLDLSKQALLMCQLLLDMFEHLAVDRGTAAEILDAAQQTHALAVEHAIARTDQIDKRASSHGLDGRPNGGRL
ncbi:MAG: hypothetical protein QOI62_1515 [Solirubrobacteraceae bacterium]|nr:hypothetical protein [Solirubrobacteraceae bacterium]